MVIAYFDQRASRRPCAIRSSISAILSRQSFSQPFHTAGRNQHVIFDPNANAFVFFQKQSDSCDEFAFSGVFGKLSSASGLT